jgi:hypothetical protein
MMNKILEIMCLVLPVDEGQVGGVTAARRLGGVRAAIDPLATGSATCLINFK